MKKLFKKIKNWEQWPFKILYAPISIVWGWYIVRSGSVWFFTPSNPKLTFGGMEGEPKREMYQLLPKEYYPTTINVKPSLPITQVLESILSENINYPFVVKPEVGGQGILFRKIDTEDQLKNYHTHTPVEYIIQNMVDYPIEVSIFYYRFPDKHKGVITGFLHKTPLQVIGDGKSTLFDLIMQNDKAKKRIQEIEIIHAKHFSRILVKGEIYRLSYAANHNRGAKFIDLKHLIDDDLVKIFDKISLSINDFFYGRYDIMCNSIEDLKKGKNFYILEYNGCGAEPNHFYDTGYTLIEAYSEILAHWKVLFQISKYNRKKGIEYWPLIKGVKFLANAKKHYKIMKEADLIID